MKRPKYFCVECNREQWLTIRKLSKHSMYVCRQCGSEICRVGDLIPRRIGNKLQNGLDFGSVPEFRSGMSDVYFTLEYPEMLSDEHRIWESADNDEEWEKDQKRIEFIRAFECLTSRQKEIVFAMQKYKTQEEAAKILGVSQAVISQTLKIIRKKLSRIVTKKLYSE